MARKGGAPAEGVVIDPYVQGAKILALEESIAKLVEAQQVNHRELIRAFQMTDAHLWVLRKICEDMALDCLIRSPAMSEDHVPGINLQAYYELFNEGQKRVAEQAAKSTVVESPDEDDIDVFGGDAVPDLPQEETNVHAIT